MGRGWMEEPPLMRDLEPSGIPGVSILGEGDESEPTGATRVPVTDDRCLGDFTVGAERRVQTVVVRIPAQISNKQLL